MAITVMWFRKDLRLEDNTAFYQAINSLQKEDSLLCVFHLDKTQFRPGTRSHDYFFEALNHFIQTTYKKQIHIHLMTDDLANAFDRLKTLYPQWDNLFFNLDNRGFGRKRDLTMIAFLESKGINVHYFEDGHLHQATDIVKEDGTFYKMFTPYYKRWHTLSKASFKPLVIDWQSINSIHDTTHFSEGEAILTQLLQEKQMDFSNIVGEEYANKQLNSFILHRLDNYEKNRDFPSIKGTSRLSPDLSIGQISIRKVYQTCLSMPESGGRETFIKELAWRDFYHMIYFNHPEQYNQELIKKYQQLPWSKDSQTLKKWENGQTGYPIIDAAMRQLNQTGWMHNRLRMLVASFLTKDLLIDWRLGADYFAKQLIDYDSASNIGGWQWAASTGTDAVPYFRIFNPTTQGKKFDKEATFIKQFVPELSHLPLKYIHEPHLMTPSEQQEYRVILDKDYPSPIIDHALARKRALEWFDIKSLD